MARKEDFSSYRQVDRKPDTVISFGSGSVGVIYKKSKSGNIYSALVFKTPNGKDTMHPQDKRVRRSILNPKL